MFLANAHALALGRKKNMVINGCITGNPKEKCILNYVAKFALCRCLVENETDDMIAVRLYAEE